MVAWEIALGIEGVVSLLQGRGCRVNSLLSSARDYLSSVRSMDSVNTQSSGVERPRVGGSM